MDRDAIREAVRLIETQFSENHDEMVMVKDIPVQGICEQDNMSYTGLAHVAYIPGESGRITGLSKLARVVDVLARTPQLQECLTTHVADCLDEALKPRGVLVVIEAEHVCTPAGQIAGSATVTSAVRGEFRRRRASRAEALSLIAGTGGRAG